MIFRIIFLFICTLLLRSVVASGQVCDSNAFAPDSLQFATDGAVRASLKIGNRLFLAGDFDIIGRPTGAFIGIDTTSTGGRPVMQATWPKIYGLVLTAITDGNGGWFVGGEFSLVGDSLRNNFAHINSAGQVTSFKIEPNGNIRCLALNGSILYMGGTFTGIGTSSRNHVAAYDVSTGLIT